MLIENRWDIACRGRRVGVSAPAPIRLYTRDDTPLPTRCRAWLRMRMYRQRERERLDQALKMRE